MMATTRHGARVNALATTVAALVAAAAIACSAVGALSSEPPRDGSTSAKDVVPRHREGSLLSDVEGIFRVSGGRQFSGRSTTKQSSASWRTWHWNGYFGAWTRTGPTGSGW